MLGSFTKKNHFYQGYNRQKVESSLWYLHYEILLLLKEYQNRYRQNMTQEEKEKVREESKEYQRQYYFKNIDDIKKRKKERSREYYLKNKKQKVMNE